MRRLAVIALILGACSLSTASQIEIIELMYLDANELAVSLQGGSNASDALTQEATGFALDVVNDVSRRAQGRSSMPDSLAYSRARSVPGGAAQDMSSLLPDGLAGPPVAAPNQNALVVRGEIGAIDRLRETIAMLDVPTPMVNVDLLMDRITRSRSREINPHLQSWGWGGDASAGSLRDPVLGFRAGGVRGLLGYDEGSSRRQVLTGSNVTGMSGTPLIISAGEIRPQIATDVWYDPWGQRRVEQYVEAVFAGMTLWVLPTVNADDTVTMVLRPVLSEVVGPAPQIGAGDIVHRTMVETTVRVPDGQPLVIGGLDRRIDEMTRSFPASRGTQRADNSSVITVTPTVIRMRGTGR
ncbi:MAG: type II secretion system protein GspD [Armatimonadota bacterium]